MTNNSIAIIGGGASAVLLAAHLESARASCNVDMYDREGRFAHGIAYSTKHPCHLLNVRAANMSAFHDDKEHFARWAAPHGYTGADFVPRILYGEYLSGLLQEARDPLALQCIKEDIVSSRRVGDHYLLSNGKTYDHVIQATGNVRPLGPRVDGVVDGYYVDPWSADFSRLLKTKSIALVGSGLTAVDMAIALDAQNYKGKTTILSRNALLPASHAEPVSFPSFLHKEDEQKRPAALLRLIRDTIKAADVPWQSVMDSLRPHTNSVWTNWSAQDRARFSRRLLTFWNVHRHRMAPQIAATIARMREEGRLEFVKGGIISVHSGPVVESTAGEFSFDAVINCLGYRYDEPGRFYETSALIGPANFGVLFETTAIPEIRAQAHAIAQKITQ